MSMFSQLPENDMRLFQPRHGGTVGMKPLRLDSHDFGKTVAFFCDPLHEHVLTALRGITMSDSSSKVHVALCCVDASQVPVQRKIVRQKPGCRLLILTQSWKSH